MSKEAVLAVVCVLGAMAAVIAGVAQHDAGAVRSAEARAAFTGGPEGSASGSSASGSTAGGSASTRVGPRPIRTGGFTVALHPGRTVAVHRRPEGRVLTQLGSRTPFGSRTVLPVVRREPGWLGVLSSTLPNGRVGWIRDDPAALDHERVRVRLLIDRSARRLSLVRGKRELMSVPVGVGRPGSETPTGTFAVTDKLDGRRYKASYGCCILALSGRQPRLPAGWRGGDRLALHGAPGAAGGARSAGCVTVEEAPLRQLVETVPLGTLVTIRP